MSEKVYEVPAEWAKRAWVNEAQYEEMYARSITDPEGFWAEHGKRIDGSSPMGKSRTRPTTPITSPIKWYEDGVTNVAYNCVDRHLAKRAGQTAIIWEGDDPTDPSTSPTPSCSIGSAISPTCCIGMASRRAIASRSICR